jgi:hypothetical protein
MQNQEEELIKQGDEAEILLSNPAFNSVINNLVDVSFQSFVNTKRQENEQRERSYNHYRAVVDIVQTLQQRVQVRDEINTKAGDNNQEDE